MDHVWPHRRAHAQPPAIRTALPLADPLSTAEDVGHSNQPFSTAALDRLLEEYRKDPADDVAEMRSAMLNERLLQHNTSGQYVRPTIGPDHPAMAKLRAEALGRHREAESRVRSELLEFLTT